LPDLGSAAHGLTRFKIALFALLSINTAIFLANGSPSEALDSIAWLTLLALFELETGGIGRLPGSRATSVIRVLRLVAAGALVVAMMGYLHDEAWPDVANVALWCAVVALLEFEVRWPDAVLRHGTGFEAIATAMYGGLAAIAALWLWRGEWFDAYDSLLWLAAFAMLEMDMLGFMRREKRA
jgi:hypothetical protein